MDGGGGEGCTCQKIAAARQESASSQSVKRSYKNKSYSVLRAEQRARNYLTTVIFVFRGGDMRGYARVCVSGAG